MPNLMRIGLKREVPTDRGFPFTLPVVCSFSGMNVDTPITFFVGENGSGKSTLLEAIACAAEVPTVGSAEVDVDDSLAQQRELASILRLAWRLRSRSGFFLRAEDFFGYLRGQARLEARMSRERTEAARGIPANEPREAGPQHVDERKAAAYLRRFDARSHGESFMDLFRARTRSGGLFLLDEPEAPLSPKRQVDFVRLLLRAAGEGAQFIVATHSPILLSCPGARIFTFDEPPIREVDADELDHIRITREILDDPRGLL